MILVIDNYDSFTYNLVQIIGAYNPDIAVVRKDELTADEIVKMNPSHVVLSPGPGRPSDSGVCKEVIHRLKGIAPILGVCLGHQAICEAFGGEITYAKELMHGKTSMIHIANGSPVFKGMPPLLTAGRYHSLCAKRDTLPDEILVIAEDEKGEVMAVKHRDYDIYGLQFHPESILTKNGELIVENFLNIENCNKNP